MPILPIPCSSSSLHVGLRAVIRTSESCIASVAVAVPTVRGFSTSPPFPRQSCFRYSTRGAPCLSGASFRPNPPNVIPPIHARTLFTFRPITRYIDLPGSYRDGDGLPFRKEDLNQKESNRIFPTNLPAPEANLLLKILHGRRVAGTLDDPSLAPNTMKFRIADQKRALEYLREHVPVDEVLNAGLRAEDELYVIEQDITEEGGSKHPPSATQEQTVGTPTGRLPKKPGDDSPYGESNFDRIRAQNIAKREAEEARIAAERKLLEEECAKGTVGTLQKRLETPREISAFRKKYLERATSDLTAPPEMTIWQRLLPIIGMAGFIIAGSIGLAAMYQAPLPSQRLWPDIPPAAATCMTLIAANVAVWALWRFPPAWQHLNKYMILIAATPRPLQLLGAMFSHQSITHLASNMAMLWFFGTRIHDEIGRGNFLALYFSSGALGFAASFTHLVLRRGLEYTTIGASGAVYGLITAFFWLHKFDEFKILGYPPDPISGPQGLAFIGLMLGLNLLSLFSKRSHDVDVVSHVAGMLAGALGIDMARLYTEYKARLRAEKLISTATANTVIEKEIDSPADTSSTASSFSRE
jgi:rhomboid-like protein